MTLLEKKIRINGDGSIVMTIVKNVTALEQMKITNVMNAKKIYIFIVIKQLDMEFQVLVMQIV